jgi:glycosyltransferase involved in cell wall biosynthesis
MKPRILIIAQVYLPGYLAGGPVRSVANIVEWLGDEFDWHILTTDRDLHGQEPYKNVVVNEWIQVGKARVFYASPDRCSPLSFLEIIRQQPYDLLYLNSFFSPKFSILPVVARRLGLLPYRPVLVAPRGEFSQGAYKLKAFKKAAFVFLSKLMGLHRVYWHASTDFEVKDIGRVMNIHDDSVFSARVFSARDLAERVEVGLPDGRSVREGDGLRVCFLSRVSPMKNLDYALKVLAAVSRPVIFDIYGPKEDPDYWAECEGLIAVLPAHVRVNYMGSVENSAVRSIMSHYALFFLPTRGENFGHVLLEAWSAGLPVLTSDQTPWRSLADKGVGWDLPLGSPERFSQIIDNVADWSDDIHRKMRVRCEDFACQNMRDELALEANRNMFLSALHAVK